MSRACRLVTVNLVNTSGPHWDQQKPLFDSISPVGPLEVAIRTTPKPAKITLQPEDQALGFEYRDGVARLTLPRLAIHSIVLIE